ncbi:carotenoid oxygenase [Saccharata proteae CBS 121410]|uniref:Carotenoid oxygenase n=1 Tax=Saccharata proteae CBS 121410 TaxID=1314787 RepID=A0A9P4LYX6_9PEZI|nr:carotenoid oxygenase [Saccharata proteae CBS 121410]
MPLAGQKRKRDCPKHPYLSGNFAPIHQTTPLTPCTYTGTIPHELVGGQYVRNGGNPISNEDLGRDAHWFDGDGMLAGVYFRKSKDKDGGVVPEFVNQFIQTDLYLASVNSPRQRLPLLPSIATLVNPASGLITIILRILRTVFLVLLSHFPGSKQAIKRISVVNTAILYHDGRALATCESGPPMRVSLPGLETVGWYNGHGAEGEPSNEKSKQEKTEPGFGGNGLFSFMKEWTTGHPKVDPVTKEMILYHCSFVPPYVHYSIIPSEGETDPSPPKLLNAPVKGVSGGKMMHDFGVSREHTIIMDLPLALDPLNLLKNKPIVHYDPTAPSRFGVFKRRDPSNVHWFETSACCIFHTANAWDEYNEDGQVETVHLLAARLTSATLVYSAGNIAPPKMAGEIVEQDHNPTKPISFFDKYDDDFDNDAEDTTSFRKACAYDRAPVLESPTHEKIPLIAPTTTTTTTTSPNPSDTEQCRLYHYTFALPHTRLNPTPTPLITTQHALSALPFEFPTLHPAHRMQDAQFVYGCSTASGSMTAALGRAVKIDVLAKLDTRALRARAKQAPPRSVSGCVDARTARQILAEAAATAGRETTSRETTSGETTAPDPIQLFPMPPGWYAQEASFVPRADAAAEDDGYLLFYAFDESQLDAAGECGDGARSELWVLDAKGMWDVVARVRLPGRVPYGLRGTDIRNHPNL